MVGVVENTPWLQDAVMETVYVVEAVRPVSLIEVEVVVKVDEAGLVVKE